MLILGDFIIQYSYLSSPPKDQYFSKFVRGLDNGDFLFSKNLQFFAKRVNGE